MTRQGSASSASSSLWGRKPRDLSSSVAVKSSLGQHNQPLLLLLLQSAVPSRILCRSSVTSWQGSTSKLTSQPVSMSRMSSTTQANEKTRGRKGVSSSKCGTKKALLKRSSTRRSLTRCSTAGTSQATTGYSSWKTWGRGRSRLSTSRVPLPRPKPSYSQAM